jgi:hypothetical protein
MTEHADEQVDVEALLKRSRTRANTLFYVVIALSAVIFIFYGSALVDKIRALTAGVSGSYAAAEKQSQLWRKNISCVGGPPKWVETTNNFKVDATVCPSGDILIRVMAPDNSEYLRWLELDNVVSGEQRGQ